MAKAKKMASGSWRVQVYAGKKPDGKNLYKSFSAPTKKEAEFLASQFRFTQKEEDVCELTFQKAAEEYIESKRNVLSPSTVRGYYAILRNWCEDLLNVKIDKITSKQIQILINDTAAEHSPKTCRNVHGFISAVLAIYAPSLQLKTTLPQKHKRDIYVPDENEIEMIYKLSIGTVSEIPIFLAAECGLRASEISALRVENITDNFINIKEANVIGDDCKEHTKAPKSVSGYRKIPITPEICEYLKANADKESGRICPRRAPTISNSWDCFRKAHNINENLNFHALRHHFASKCLLLGMPQKYIAELMGHSSTNMIEQVYQHVFPSAMDEYADKIRTQMLNLYSHKNIT